VLQSFTAEQRWHRVECCRIFIGFVVRGRYVLQRIMTVMEVGVFKSILTRQFGMAWNEISPAEESQVEKIACQDNADPPPMLPE